MSEKSPIPTASTRCAAAARVLDTDPCGSSGSYAGFLLVAAPMPWPRDVSELTDPTGELMAARERSWRVQAVANSEAAVEPGVVARFWREGVDYDSDQPARHVLLCTHGRRDRCCGADGTRLYETLAATWRRPDRLWRTSHLGGHRFAPTALIVPDGTMWAFLDAPTLEAIVDRSTPAASVIRHYRGSTLLDRPVAQLADRAALERVGWAWFDGPRRATLHAWSEDAVLVEIDNSEHRFTIRLEFAGHVPVPKCGEPTDASTPTERRFRVSSVIAT